MIASRFSKAASGCARPSFDTGEALVAVTGVQRLGPGQTEHDSAQRKLAKHRVRDEKTDGRCRIERLKHGGLSQNVGATQNAQDSTNVRVADKRKSGARQAMCMSADTCNDWSRALT